MFALKRSTGLFSIMKNHSNLMANMCSATNYKTLQVTTPAPFVYHVELNRPSKRNCLSTDMWFEIKECFEKLSDDADCRVIVLSGIGKIFCAGIDLMSMGGVLGELGAAEGDLARKGKVWGKTIPRFQECLTSLEKCSKPVLAAIHSGCIGAGVDMVTAADMRYCSKDAWFQIKEIMNRILDHNNLVANMCSATNYKTLQVTAPAPFVYHVELNRPSKRNAINLEMWLELQRCFEILSDDADCRVIVLSGAGKLFCAGIDLMSMGERFGEIKGDLARKGKEFGKNLARAQESLSSLERCSKPVLVAIHSACVGAGVDMIIAADMRYCTKDAWFQVKEIDIGMAADVGTLQRLPKVIGSESLVRELCYTGRQLPSEEALSCGLVSRVFDNKESLLAGALEIAKNIASKSPVAVQGTKKSLIFARDHSVQDGLDQIADWNRFMLQSEDFSTAVGGALSKETDIPFAKL